MSNKLFIGVDLGGTTTKLAVINYYGEILYKWEIVTDVTDHGKNIITNIAKTIDQTLEEKGYSRDNVIGVGMGAPGPVNLKTGVIYEAVNLGWENNYPLKDLLEVETSLPAVVDNDANCAALGEMWKGAGEGAKDIICVTLGTGVGGGVIANGDIVHGINGAAGEIGHYTSIANGGFLCNCGKTGCLETIASATGIVRIAVNKLSQSVDEGALQKILKRDGNITAKDVFDCARDGDEAAKNIIEEVAFHLGLALANVANTLNPEKIVIGGGVSRAGDILLSPVKEYFQKFAFVRVAKSTEITLATLGNDAGVIGAAWLTKNKIVK